MKIKSLNTKVSDIDRLKGIVTIAVSGLGNVDSDNEIIQKGAYKKTISEGIDRIRHLKDHSPYELLGYPLELYETEKHLIAVSKINLDKQIAKDVMTDYLFFAENGKTIEHSVGIRSFKDKQQQDKETGATILTEVKLYEYSTLSFLGANENTPFISAKGFKDFTQEEIEQLYNFKGFSDQRYKELENLLARWEEFKKATAMHSQEPQDKGIAVQETLKYLIENL